MSSGQKINELVTMAIQNGGWMELDRMYLTNRVFSLVGKDEHWKIEAISCESSMSDILNSLTEVAIKNKMIQNREDEKARLQNRLADIVTPPPSVVNALFAQRYAKDKKDATNYFYTTMKENNYIQSEFYPKESLSTVYGEYKRINVTAHRNISTEICPLCFYHEGYLGNKTTFASSTQRILRMNVQGESWGFQYHPYPIVNEECILAPEEHINLPTDREIFVQAFNLLEIFPHYFIMKNYSHDDVTQHGYFIGGHEELPIFKATNKETLTIKLFPNVEGKVLDWPVFAIQLKTTNKENLIQLAYYMQEQWRKVQSNHYTHPIVYKDNDEYVMILLFLQNSASFSSTIWDLVGIILDDSCEKKNYDSLTRQKNKEREEIKLAFLNNL